MTRNDRRFDAILFDWDDTLCGASPHRYEHAREVARAFGIDLTPAEVYQAFVRAGDSSLLPIDTFRERLPAEIGIDPDQHGAFIHAYLQRDVYKRFELFDDVLEVIERLGEHDLHVGIISNNTELTQYIEMLDMHHHFEIIVSPQTFGVAKPDPDIFLRTLEILRVPPERTLYVGDSYDNDVIGARAAGLTPVLIDRFGINLDAPDTEHRVESLNALVQLLDELLHGDEALDYSR